MRNIASGRPEPEVSLAHAGGIDDLALSPDGAWLASLTPAPTGRVVLRWPLWPELLRGKPAGVCTGIALRMVDVMGAAARRVFESRGAVDHMRGAFRP